MDQLHTHLFITGIAFMAELEAIKLQNAMDEKSGKPLSFTPEDLWKKAQEIRNTANEVFKY